MAWLARRVVGEDKVLNALQTSYFLVSSHTAFGGEDGQKVFQFISQRYFEYDQAMINSPDNLDVVYVAGLITQRVFVRSPETWFIMRGLK